MSNFYLYFLNIVFLLICLSTILCLDIFYNFFKKIPKQAIYYSLGIFCLALIIRSACIPHMHHVYYDEFYFIDLAKNILKHNIYGATVIGDRSHLLAFSAPIRPAGYPLLISYIFRFFSESAQSIFQTNAVFGALSVLLIFWIAYLLFKDNFPAAFWGAIVFNFFPAHLKYSGSACSDIISIFFILSCIFLGLLCLKEKKAPLIYLFTSTFIFLSYIKPENLLFSPPAIIFFFILTRKRLIKRSEALFLTSCVFLALLPLILQLPDVLRPENINSKGHFVSFGNIFNNILPNIGYLFDFRFFLVTATLFFILGLVFLFSEDRKIWLILVGWYFFFFIVQSSYFDNKFSLLFAYDSDRRFLYPAISFCMIAGYSIAYFLEKIPFMVMKPVKAG